MKKLLATIFALIFFIMPCLNACGRAEELPYVAIVLGNFIGCNFYRIVTGASA